MKRILPIGVILCIAAMAAAGPWNRAELDESKWTLLSAPVVTETGQRTLVQGVSIDANSADEALDFINTYSSTKNKVASRYVTIPEGEANGQRFAGTYVMGRVSYDGESGMIIRELHLVRLISAIADLVAAENVQSRDNSILEPFNFKTGEADQWAVVWYGIDPASETACMETITDAQIVAAFASGLTYVGRHWNEEADGTATFSIALQGMVWNTWATNAADHVSYTDYGRDGENRQKTWENYRIADSAAMMAYLGTDSHADTNFHIASVSLSNGRNGSFAVVQRSVKKVDELSSDGVLSDIITMDAHDLQSGTQNVTTAIYEHFSLAELAAISESVPSGYKIVSQSTRPDGELSGLYSRTYVYEKVTWRAWSTSLTNDIISYSGIGSRKNVRRTWTGLANTNVIQIAEDLIDGSMAPPVGYTITGANVSPAANGSATATQSARIQESNTTVTASEMLNAHSMCEGIMNRTTISFSGYTNTASVPNPANYVIGTDAGVVANGLTGPDGEGLFGRTIVIETTTWAAWSNQTASSWTYISYGAPGREGEQITKVWCGIQSEDATNALADLESTNFIDSGYAVTRTSFNDSGNGSVSLTQVQTDINILDAATSWSMTPFSTDTSKTDRNMLSAIEHGTNQTQGFAVSTRDTLTADGLHDHTYTTNAATLDVTARTDRSVSTLSDSSSIVVRNQTNAVAPVTVVTNGTIVSTQAALNETLTWDNSTHTETAIPDVTVQTSYADGVLSDSYSVTVDNHTNGVTDGVAVANGVITVKRGALNKFGMHTVTTSEETAKTNIVTQQSYSEGVMANNASVTILNTETPVTNGTAVAGGKIIGTRSVRNQFDLFDVTLSTNTANPNVTGATSVAFGVMSDRSSISIANTTNDIPDGVEVTNGVITDISSRLNEFGLRDVTTSTDTANLNVTNSQSFTKSKFRESESVTIANQTNEISSGTAVTNGIITTVKDDLNAFGLHDHTTSTDKAVESVAVRVSQTITPFDTTFSTNSINLANATDFATNQTAGRIVSQTRETNEHGLTDESISVKSSTTNIPSRYTMSKGILSSRSSVTTDNQINEVTSASAVSNGIITEVGSSLNQYGWWDVTLSTNEAIRNVTNATSASFGVLSDRESQMVSNSTNDAPDGVEVSGGVITDLSSRLNEFGLRDITTATDTANPNVTNRNSLAITAFSTNSVEVIANQTNAAYSGSSVTGGVITVISSDLNKYGLRDNTTETDTAVQDLVVRRTFENGILSYSSSVVTQNVSTAITNGTEVSGGVITSSSSSLNKYNLNDNTVSTDTANLNVTNRYSATLGVLSDRESTIVANVTNAVTSGTSVSNGVVTTIDSQLNAHGLQNVSTSTDSAIPDVTNRITVAKDAFSESTVETVANKSSAVEAYTYATNGVQTKVSSDLNAHGWWDVTTSSETSTSNVLSSTNTAQTVFETRTGEARRGLASPVDSTLETNLIITANNTVQPDGWYAISRDIRRFNTVTNATISYTATAFGVSTNTRSVNMTTIPDVPTGSVGVVRSLTVTKTDANAYDIEERSATVRKDLISGNDVSKDEFNTVTTIKDIGKTAQVTNDWETDGDFTLDVANVLDESGLWNTTVRTNEFNAVPSAQTTTTADAFGSQARVVSRHSDSDLEDVSTVTEDNEIVIHSSQKDPTGKYDNTATTNTPIAQTYTNVISLSEFGGVTVIKAHNADSIDTPTEVSGTNSGSSVSGSMNQFGLYDYSKQTHWHTAASDISSGSFSWKEQSQPTYKIVVYAGDVVSSVGEYYREYIHTVTLYDTQILAWEARDAEGHDPVKTSMQVGQFSSGVWYYHTAYRGTNDEVVVYP